MLKGLRAMRVPEERIETLQIVVTSAPQRSRGCADVGGRRISIAIASPSHFSLRRLARLVEHEVAHVMGLDHRDMPEALLYSLGPTPSWAEGARLRYRGRARSTFDLLRKPGDAAAKASKLDVYGSEPRQGHPVPRHSVVRSRQQNLPTIHDRSKGKHHGNR